MLQAIIVWEWAWSLIGILACCALLFETLPDAWRRLNRGLRHGGFSKPDYRSLAETYGGADWPKVYFNDLWTKTAVAWAPFVQWRQRPCKTPYFTFEESGLRRTINPESISGQRPFRIVMFGGSTTVGVGARDEATIPSILSQELCRRGHSVHIVNWGQLGHSSTQEMISFHQFLKTQDEAPDLVLFYDGVNEIIPAEQSGEADSMFNGHHRAAEFNLLHASRRGELIRNGLKAMFPRLLRRMHRLFGFSYQRLQDVAALPGVEEQRVAALANAIANAYIDNVRAIAGLAKAQGVEALFFLQPTIFQKKRLSVHEDRYRLDGAPRPAIRQPLFESAYRCIKKGIGAGGQEQVIDLSDLFADLDEPLFIDPFHLGEVGNYKIADAMLPYVEAALACRKRG